MRTLFPYTTLFRSRAVDLGLVVNVGHDLNLKNLPPLVAKLPMIAEASIGHELTADALEMGFGAALGAYKAVLGFNLSATRS